MIRFIAFLFLNFSVFHVTSFASEELSGPSKRQRVLAVGEDDAAYWVKATEDGRVVVSKNFFEESRPETRGGAITCCTGPSVTILDLTDSGFESGVVEIVRDSLMNKTNLQTLFLGNNSLCPTNAACLMDTLKTYAPLQILDLSFCTLGRGNVQIIANFLASKHTLKSLDLEGNRLGDTGAISIANNLFDNTSLKCLYLPGNSIGVESVKVFGQMLRRNTSLEVLCLGCCDSVLWNENEIGDEGAEFIASGLRVNRTLRSLCLSFNNIRGAGSLSIMDALCLNTTLARLDLSNNHIEVCGDDLEKALQKNKGLEELNLRWNSLDADQISRLIDVYLSRESFSRINFEKKKKRERVDLKKLISRKIPSGAVRCQEDGWIVKVS
jgi:Ran GTPase-activating protein (RanGAP) involved in mRNA processing and transport